MFRLSAIIMICPSCGQASSHTLDNQHDSERTVLGTCPSCQTEVYEGGTTRTAEPKQLQTVREGEQKEDAYAELALDTLGGERYEDRGRFDDIDKNIYDADDSLLYALEIKTRTCTMNGYKDTKFPYRKIEKAREITEEKGVPVHIMIVFTDGVGKLTISDEQQSFVKGNENFVPRYRSETSQTQQIPVEYPVEELDVLTL